MIRTGSVGMYTPCENRCRSLLNLYTTGVLAPLFGDHADEVVHKMVTRIVERTLAYHAEALARGAAEDYVNVGFADLRMRADKFPSMSATLWQIVAQSGKLYSCVAAWIGSYSTAAATWNPACSNPDQNTQGGMEGLRFPLLGLFGEVGSLLSALKRKQRDQAAYVGYRQSVIEEFGDVLWYFSNIAARANLNLSDLARKLPRDLNDWDKTASHAFATFADLQSFHASADTPADSVFEQRLIELAGKVGRLLDDVALDRIERHRDALAAHLVEIFRALVSATDKAGIALEDAARQNIAKTRSRWPRPEERVPPALFDEDDDPEERLPRRMK